MPASMTKRLIKGWAKQNARLRALCASSYFDLLLEAFDALDTSYLYHSWTHGQGHIERTMLLGALIAHGEGLDRELTRLLLLCCSYHDVGRVNDWVDNRHGQRSAERILDSALQQKFASIDEADFPLCLAAISAHSVSDSRREQTGRAFGIDEAQMPRYMLLSACLKDADNLDRVRIHDLDPSHLRCPTARALPSTARWIFESFSQPE